MYENENLLVYSKRRKLLYEGKNYKNIVLIGK